MADEDKNRNRSRKDAKSVWKRFHRALAILPEASDAKQTWETLPSKTLRTRYMNAWNSDPSWGFVEVFKRESMTEVHMAETQMEWLTRAEVQRKFGKAGARQVMVAKKKMGPTHYKIDEDDGLERFRVKNKEVERTGIKHAKEKGVACRSDVDKSSTPVGSSSAPSALQDPGLPALTDAPILIAETPPSRGKRARRKSAPTSPPRTLKDLLPESRFSSAQEVLGSELTALVAALPTSSIPHLRSLLDAPAGQF